MLSWLAVCRHLLCAASSAVIPGRLRIACQLSCLLSTPAVSIRDCLLAHSHIDDVALHLAFTVSNSTLW